MKEKGKPIQFDEKISYQLDRALIASESENKLRRQFGKFWKRKLERKIFGHA